MSFYRQRGFSATVSRSTEAIRRGFYFGRTLLYSCRLPIKASDPTHGISVSRYGDADLPDVARRWLVSQWNHEGREVEIAERLKSECEVWLVCSDDTWAGFGWTIKNRTFREHFFPIQSDEVHLFDFFVAKEFRGRGLNRKLMESILIEMGKEGLIRAHIECAAWNFEQIRSLRKTHFIKYAEATKLNLIRSMLVIWHDRINRQ